MGLPFAAVPERGEAVGSAEVRVVGTVLRWRSWEGERFRAACCASFMASAFERLRSEEDLTGLLGRLREVIMLRIMLRKPVGGLPESSECAEFGRDSISMTEFDSENRLVLDMCEEGLGGTMPSKDMKEPPTLVGLSVRIIKRRLLGAGLQGLVGGNGA